LEKIRRDRRFLCVQIYRGSCRESAAAAGVTYSFRDVPRLPLKGCDAKVCTCQYRGVSDRRIGLDRRMKRDRRQISRLQLDRRIGRDRRPGKDIWRGHDR